MEASSFLLEHRVTAIAITKITKGRGQDRPAELCSLEPFGLLPARGHEEAILAEVQVLHVVPADPVE